MNAIKLILSFFLIILPISSYAISIDKSYTLTLWEDKVIELNNKLSYWLKWYWFIWWSISNSWWKIVDNKFIFSPKDIWNYSWKIFALDFNGNTESTIINFAVMPKKVDKIISLPKEKIIKKQSYTPRKISNEIYYLRNLSEKKQFFQNLHFHYYTKAFEHQISIEYPKMWLKISCEKWAEFKNNGSFYDGILSLPKLTLRASDGLIMPTNGKVILKFNDQISNINWCKLEIDKTYENQWVKFGNNKHWYNIPSNLNDRFVLNLNSLPLIIAFTNETESRIKERKSKILEIKKKEKIWTENEYYNYFINSWIFSKTDIRPTTPVSRWQWAAAIVNYFKKNKHKRLIRNRLIRWVKQFSDSNSNKWEAQEILSYIWWIQNVDYFLPDMPLTKWNLASIFLNADRNKTNISIRELRIKEMINNWYLLNQSEYYDVLDWNEFAKRLFKYKEIIQAKRYKKIISSSSENIKQAIEDGILSENDVRQIKLNWLSLWIFLKTLALNLDLEYESSRLILEYLKKDYKYVTWLDVNIDHKFSKYFALWYDKAWVLTPEKENIYPNKKITKIEAAQIVVRALWKSSQSFWMFKNIKDNLDFENSFEDIDFELEKNKDILFLLKNDIIWNFSDSAWFNAKLFLPDQDVQINELIKWSYKIKSYKENN